VSKKNRTVMLQGTEHQHAADLHWLAFLLTGDRELSLDLAVEAVTSQGGESETFSTWMLAWSRRVVIAKALASIRDELAASARRTKLMRQPKVALPDRDWALDPGTGRADLERALLAIDVFPRAAVVLSIFEGVLLQDAAVLLDAAPEFVKKARSIGVAELTNRLARMQGWAATVSSRLVTPSILPNETQYA
jgi:DNA-directed RNA polymerase specialized sigma24 family protein